MLNAGCFKLDGPLTTEFLLMKDYKDNPCPRFYGKAEDKKKVYHQLKENIHPEVHAKWGPLECHCGYIRKIRLSKTARNLNQVFLTCGVPYNREEQRPKAAPCQYFQWVHTGIYPLPSDPAPEWLVKFAVSRQPYKPRPLKSFDKSNQDQQTTWFQQVQQNVNQWNREQANKTRLNQFAESARQQEEEALKKKTSALPSTFAWSPEIAEHYKKQEQAKQQAQWKREKEAVEYCQKKSESKNYRGAKKAEEPSKRERIANCLPEKLARLRAFQKGQALKEQEEERVPEYHQQFINGVNQNPCKLRFVLF